MTIKGYRISIAAGIAGCLLFLAIIPARLLGSFSLALISLVTLTVVFIFSGCLGGRLLDRWNKRHKQRPVLRICGIICWALFVPAFAFMILLYAGIPLVGSTGTLCPELLNSPFVHYGRQYLNFDLIGSPSIEHCSGSPKVAGCLPQSSRLSFGINNRRPCDRFGYPLTSTCYYLSYEPSIFTWRRTLVVVARGCDHYDIINADNMGFLGYYENDAAGG